MKTPRPSAGDVVTPSGQSGYYTTSVLGRSNVHKAVYFQQHLTDTGLTVVCLFVNLLCVWGGGGHNMREKSDRKYNCDVAWIGRTDSLKALLNRASVE